MPKHRGPGRPRKYHRLGEKATDISPEAAKGILAIVLLLFGGVFLLSMINLAGSLGHFVRDMLRLIFGYPAYLLPLFLLFFGWKVLKQDPENEETHVKLSAFIGLLIFFLSFCGLIHLFVDRNIASDVARGGYGGGMLGYGVSWAFMRIIAFWASLFVLIALVIISVIITFNTSLGAIANGITRLFGVRSEEEKDAMEGSGKTGFWHRIMNSLGAWQKGRQERNQKEQALPEKPAQVDEEWTFPSVELLEDKISQAKSGDVEGNVKIIKKTLVNFGIEVAMGEVNIGPTVTQYTLKPSTGVKLNQITARANDLALALAAHPIRIEAPIPGRSAVGIEVPNKVPAMVYLREMFATKEYQQIKSNLGLMLGRDAAGNPVATDIKKMPHLLIAGATGSGKSVCITSIITTLLFRNSPKELKLLLVDPKRVELVAFNDIPHLLSPVIVDKDKTINSLKWAVSEMENRYQVLNEAGKRNIEAYNITAKKNEKMPYIVMVIDELADLMAASARDVEGSIVRIAQMARAVGIHLIVATQRPSVDVITGLIKANITTRIAFAVASQVDSRTILDMSGAEKLLGNGDMLFLSSDIGKPKRVQGVFVSDKEIKNLTQFIKSKGSTNYNDEIANYHTPSASRLSEGGESGDDELFDDAVEVVTRAKKASASLLQRRLRVGYARAARLLDILEERGVVGPADGSKPRDVLIDEGGKIEFEDH